MLISVYYNSVQGTNNLFKLVLVQYMQQVNNNYIKPAYSVIIIVAPNLYLMLPTCFSVCIYQCIYH